MNKKKYVTPECKWYHLQTQKMLTGSFNPQNTLNGGIEGSYPGDYSEEGGGSNPSPNANEGTLWGNNGY